MRYNIKWVIKFHIFLFVFGVGVLAKKTEAEIIYYITKDILFINGCDVNTLPHPFRYRVLHQIEQLNSGFLESDVYDYRTFDPNITRNYRVIIFYRCPWNQRVNKSIILARELNKKVLFDIDDLVIDKKYTKLIPFLKTLKPKEKKIYDDGVKKMRRTLLHCDGAITTTKVLANELKKYVPKVFINHNVASEEMWELSKNALITKSNKTNGNNVTIGYFSGSITHNSDIEMIKPALIKILKEYDNVKLLFLGELTLQENFINYTEKIINKKFTDWRQLPKIISNVDINIAPLENTIFNQAKSENKWVEASLVKVPTIASNIGSFKNSIRHNETGLLCDNINDWYISLKTLINNQELRKYIGENAYNVCKRKYNTIYTGRKLSNYINKIANKHIGFFLPSLDISGGIYVILKHACILKDEGWDVDLILPQGNNIFFEFQSYKFNVISLQNNVMSSQYDVIVATLYSTFFSVLAYYKAKKHLYLVQNYETDFYSYGNYFRSIAEKTYLSPFGIEYITISKWCEHWLLRKYNQKSKYAPNGIDLINITSYKRNLNKYKIRILIEGDSNSHYKNVDESFKIVDKLNKNRFEIWYMSYNGKPKKWYKVDKFLNKVPFHNVTNIYKQCDILLKSSWLESFSYPPLEMMATGGYCIVVPNGGNKEYLKNEKNCLFYKLGNINEAVNAINRLINDKELQNKLYENGLETARHRDWKYFRSQILSLYEI